MRTKALQPESKGPMEKARPLQRPAVSMPQPIGVAASLLSLQRSHGNQYVQRLLRSRRIQAKLTISEPGDEYEQEADRVAETVMRMPEPIASEGVTVSGRVKDVHTRPGSSTDAEKLHRQTMEEEEEETLQAKEVSGETPEVTPELEARLESARGGGQPLPESVRAFFEPRFGYDFGGVRVHTDGQAVDSARSVKAHAYTLGQDIVFGSGQYAPETPSGKQLLAHELTHVVQQTGTMAGTAGHRSAGPLAPSAPLRPSQSGILERKCACGGAAGLSGECAECSKNKQMGLQTKLKINEPGDIYEQEADRIADQVMATPAHHAVSGAPPRIQRFSEQSNGQMDATPASVDHVLSSAGRPLDPALRQDMEQRFGHDFSRVRVHSGAVAEQSARDVNAHAYTVGHNIVFSVGRFAPETHQGRQLLAHELTHVVQQEGDVSTGVVQRAEVDDRSCAGLTDIETDVDTKVQSEISAARTAAGTPLTGARLTAFLTDVKARLGAGIVSPIEQFIEALPATKRTLPSSLTGTKYAGATAANVAYRGQGVTLPGVGLVSPVRSAAQVKGICIGADKLGHFFSEAFIYFRLASGGVPTPDIEDVGRGLEIGIQGLGATGVFSNADRAANRAGLKFYQDLQATPSLTFNIKNFISNDWNEQSNPSFYESGLAGVVWSNLLTGSWMGSFTSGGTSAPIDSKVVLSATTAGNVTGTHEWPAGAAKPQKETIKNGVIAQRTTAVSGIDVTGSTPTPASATPVSGVSINFDWEARTSSGKGKWDSVNEQTLDGTWGIGSSITNGGTWKLKRV